ncbi:MAG: hypothetical protein LUD52_01950, partial [Opitutae bacterium]|nr:hypothetical protein [Opitutae bacterium]
SPLTRSPPANLAGESRTACARSLPPPTLRNKPKPCNNPATNPSPTTNPRFTTDPLPQTVRGVSPEQIRVTSICGRLVVAAACLLPPPTREFRCCGGVAFYVLPLARAGVNC